MSFNRNWTVKATRKPTICTACMQRIPAGSTVEKWAGMSDGEFYTASYHTDCRAAEIALNELLGTYPDEWQPLADIDSEDVPWLVETFPAVAARKGFNLSSENSNVG